MRTGILAALLSAHGALSFAQAAPTSYHGACDGSGAAAVDADHFVVANDDTNVLLTYRFGNPKPVSSFDLNPSLKPERRKKDGSPKEVDIEGAARVGNRIYWIGSHGRDSKGEKESSRHRFFATDLGSGSPPAISAVVGSYENLLKNLLEQVPGPSLKEAAKQAPESEGGLNIEGLAAAPDGQLMIGFRNPRPNGKALVILLENPAKVVETNAQADFGRIEELGLEGRGIRSIEWIGSRYLIVAGPFNGKAGGDFALYAWGGPGRTLERLKQPADFDKLRPEALFARSGAKDLYLLSDDGTDACKGLPESARSFRGLAVTLPD